MQAQRGWTPQLILATAAHTWLFDRDTHQFARHSRIGDAAKVKSVHVNPARKRLLWVQGEGTVWWSDVLRFHDPDAAITLPGEKVYKVRWMPSARPR